MAARLRLSRSQLRALQITGSSPDASGAKPGVKPGTKPTRIKRPRRPWFGPGDPVELPVVSPDALLRIRLPIRLSNNNGGRSGVYFESATFRKKCQEQLTAWGLKWTQAPDRARYRFPMPVIARVIRVLGKNERKWDTSSILRGNYKELEDSLVAIGWFPNDSPQWITATHPDQDDTQRQHGPAIMLEIMPAEKS